MIKQKLFPVKIEKSDALHTPHSGLLIFAEALKAYGILDKLEQLPLPGSNRGYEFKAIILAIMLSMAGGGETLEDVVRLFDDKVLCKILNLKPFSASTLCKWLRRNSKVLLTKLSVIAEQLMKDLITKSERPLSNH